MNKQLETPADGLKLAVPIIVTYLGLGFAGGALAARVGLSPLEVALFSTLVFSGLAHFLFVGMLGGPAVTMIGTIALTGFRHFLYSSAIAHRARDLPIHKRMLIAPQLTDESFAVISSFTHGPIRRIAGIITLNNCIYASWCTGTITGAIVGGAAGEQMHRFGIDFAAASMFAALLMLQVFAYVRRWPMIFVSVTAAGLLVVLELFLPNGLNLLISSCIAAALGVKFFGLPKPMAEEREERAREQGL